MNLSLLYANNTKHICLCLAITTFLIILFMMTPLSTFLISSFIGKLVILSLLGYILYSNIYLTNKFANNYNLSLLSGNWNEGKTNILCSYIFTLFTIFLFISILRQLF